MLSYANKLFLSEILYASSSLSLDYHKESIQSHEKFLLWAKHCVRHCGGEGKNHLLGIIFSQRSIQNCNNKNACKLSKNNFLGKGKTN